MDNGDLERVFESAEAQFEAALAAQEDGAAADLALSLRHGQDAVTLLTRAAWQIRLAEGASVRVESVGPDVVMGRTPSGTLVLSPLARAVLAEVDGVPPARTDHRLVSYLRHQARAGVRVKLTTDRGSFEGRLATVTESHALVDRGGRRCAVPIAALAEVWLLE